MTPAPQAATRSRVSSIDPSSMTITSKSRYVCAKIDRSAASMVWPALYAGMTTEISGIGLGTVQFGSKRARKVPAFDAHQTTPLAIRRKRDGEGTENGFARAP